MTRLQTNPLILSYTASQSLPRVCFASLAMTHSGSLTDVFPLSALRLAGACFVVTLRGVYHPTRRVETPVQTTMDCVRNRTVGGFASDPSILIRSSPGSVSCLANRGTICFGRNHPPNSQILSVTAFLSLVCAPQAGFCMDRFVAFVNKKRRAAPCYDVLVVN